MRHKRSLLGVIGALVIVLMAALATGPAHAIAPTDDGTPGQVLELPSAPEDVPATSTQGTRAPSPGISPATTTVHVQFGAPIPCPPGNLCPVVIDHNKPGYYKVFFLYTCTTYRLSYWYDTGSYVNNQVGNPTSYFYGKSGNVIKSFERSAGMHGTQFWYPVWSIRNC